MEKVQALMGHANISLTIDIYGHIQPEEHAKEVAKTYRPGQRATFLKVIEGGA
jgi:site-specific recombinase XerD